METHTHYPRRLAGTAAFALPLAVLPAQRASAHAGDLDPTFGNGGIVILPNRRAEAPFDTADAVAIPADGKIVVAGRWGAVSPGPTFAVARFNPDGTLDGSFGFGGLSRSALATPAAPRRRESRLRRTETSWSAVTSAATRASIALRRAASSTPVSDPAAPWSSTPAAAAPRFNEPDE